MAKSAAISTKDFGLARGSMPDGIPRLKRHGRFWVDDNCQTAGPPGPKVMDLEGRAYHRFMDYVYSPLPPEELGHDAIRELCDLRIDLFDLLVNKSLNESVISCMCRVITREFDSELSPIRVLDFGCGTGFSSILFKHAWRGVCDISGVDISEKAIRIAASAGVDARLLARSDGFPFPPHTFDAVIASFVMHFQIDPASLREIHRVLKPRGVFSFNVYNNPPVELWDSLADSGFRTWVPSGNCDLPGTHRVWCARAGPPAGK